MAGSDSAYALSWMETGLLLKRADLRIFLESDVRVHAPFQRAGRGIRGWIGWGRKNSGLRAAARARRDGVGVALLEDGFLRSHGLGVSGARALSIVIDHTGMYYDATGPSDLENMLQAGDFDARELKRAAELLEILRREGLSKYNAGLPVPRDSFQPDEERVLVVDQTADDASLRYGLVDKQTFPSMLEAALEENPNARIYVKTHPDVLAGKRRGAMPMRRDARIVWLSENWHPHDLLAHFGKVYVATSLMGLDALVLNRQVHCFGMPFYAGWGLTHDRKKCHRRSARRTLEELIAAAYLRYAKYIDPETGALSDAFTVARYLARQKRHLRFWSGLPGQPWSGRVFAFGFRLWKQAQAHPFFGTDKVIFARSARHARKLGITAADRMAVWGLREDAATRDLANELAVPLVRVEDGFIRSNGLGADFIPPSSLVFDSSGIYFDPGAPSDLERLLINRNVSARERERAARLIELIVRKRITKYNLGPARPLPPPEGARGKRVILVPGQVETDASILRGSPDIKENIRLLRRVRKSNPDAFIIYKPHPDVLALNRRGHVHMRKARALADYVAMSEDILSCIDWADETHTLTSLSGFDSLLRGKRVVCYGLPFYAGWGLTEDKISPPRRRNRKLSLEEFVHCVLLEYPRYHLRDTPGFVKPESVIDKLCADRDHDAGWGSLRRFPRKMARKVKWTFLSLLQEGRR